MSVQVVLLSLFFLLCFSASSAFQPLHCVDIRSITSGPSHPHLTTSSIGQFSTFNAQRPISISRPPSPPSNSLLSANNDDRGENETKSSKAGFSIIPPTLNQLGFAWLLFISGNRVYESLPNLLNEDSTGSKQLVNIAINAILFVGSVLGLAKSLAKVDYQSLDDLSKNSLAQQAGQWAVSGEVPSTYQQYQIATFAGGCFWGTELHYQRIPGVVATCVGYTQGKVESPNYDQVCSGATGHAEGIQLIYDPEVVSYERLLTKLFALINPTLKDQVGNDRGTQYRHGVYYHTEEQFDTATRFIADAQLSYEDSIVTDFEASAVFWPAENYHQRYLEKGGQSADKECEETVRCYG